MNTVFRQVLAAVVLVFLTSCGDEAQRERVLGMFWVKTSETVAIVVPREAVQGKPFEVSVSTLGGGCTELGETEVEVNGLAASVTPYNYETIPASHSACTTEAKEIVHTATLTFAQSGTGTITFHGRNPDYSSPNTLLSVTRTVTVR